jgi:hypothetical protein
MAVVGIVLKEVAEAIELEWVDWVHVTSGGLPGYGCRGSEAVLFQFATEFASQRAQCSRVELRRLGALAPPSRGGTSE